LVNKLTHTLTTTLINNTTTTTTTDNKISYNYPNSRNGLSNTYSVLGLIVSTETTKERGWNLYETSIRIAYKGHYTPDGFSEWVKEYKNSLGVGASSRFVIHSAHIENHSANKIAKAHELSVLIGESYVLTIINKYIELLFNSVNKETIVRQIDELTSQLQKVSA
jgi:hypothetical protein